MNFKKKIYIYQRFKVVWKIFKKKGETKIMSISVNKNILIITIIESSKFSYFLL